MHLPLSKVRKAIALRFPSDSIRITVFLAKSHVQMVHMRGIWACKSRTSGEYSRKRPPKEALFALLAVFLGQGHGLAHIHRIAVGVGAVNAADHMGGIQ